MSQHDKKLPTGNRGLRGFSPNKQSPVLQDGAICLTNGGACYSGNPPFADCWNIRSASHCSFCNFAELFFAPHFICRISIGDYHLFCRKKYFFRWLHKLYFHFLCKKEKPVQKSLAFKKRKIPQSFCFKGFF